MRISRLTLSVACLSAVSSALVVTPHAGASGSGAGRTPTAAARADGVTSAGGGFMGWHNDRSAHGAAAQTTLSSSTDALGVDVARYQGTVAWSSLKSQGFSFAYVKATESTNFLSPTFAAQYNGSYNAGFIRGSYHFATPNTSTGAAQADYFIAHGGGWSKDGKTLPGALDIEYNPYGATCYGLSQASMVSWISSFVSRYKSRTGRDPVIYSTFDWWNTCTGNSSAFAKTSPFWIAQYSHEPTQLPSGTPYYTFWQYNADSIDKDRFNGPVSGVQKLATG